MGSVAIYEKGDRFDCVKCTDGSLWTAQGRSKEWAQDRVKRRMKSKGCVSETKTPVVRLVNGDKIFRCPRGLAGDAGAMSHFTDYINVSNSGLTVEASTRPWKWHQVWNIVRNEVTVVENAANKN